MTSLCFQLRISLLLYVGLSYKLVKEISIVHLTFRLYKISCDLEGHHDMFGQLQGKWILFIYRLISAFITLYQLLTELLQFVNGGCWKRNFWLYRYYVINIFKFAYLLYFLFDWTQTSFSKIRLMICICIFTWHVIWKTRSLTKWRKPTSLIH